MVSRWRAIAAGIVLTISTASSATAHTSWLDLDPDTAEPTNRICGSEATPYLAQTWNQTQILGVRCLKKNINRRTSSPVSQLLWYGADQWQGNRYCQLGTAYASAPALPSVLAGEATNISGESTELSLPGLEPLSVQVVNGTWPAPLKIQLQGSRNEVWIRISNARIAPPLVNSLRSCDRDLQNYYFNQPRRDPDWQRDRSYDDWLTRVGSGWDWLLHGPNR